MRKVLKKFGAPEDLVLSIDEPTMGASAELMARCDLVVATGGGGLVKAAYSSGTPAYGVGAGNAVVIVDETAELADACDKIYASKVFDNATSCSSDNSIVVQDAVYGEVLERLQAKSTATCTPEDQEKLRQMMFFAHRPLQRKDGVCGREPERIAGWRALPICPRAPSSSLCRKTPPARTRSAALPTPSAAKSCAWC